MYSMQLCMKTNAEEHQDTCVFVISPRFPVGSLIFIVCNFQKNELHFMDLVEFSVPYLPIRMGANSIVYMFGRMHNYIGEMLCSFPSHVDSK